MVSNISPCGVNFPLAALFFFTRTIVKENNRSRNHFAGVYRVLRITKFHFRAICQFDHGCRHLWKTIHLLCMQNISNIHGKAIQPLTITLVPWNWHETLRLFTVKDGLKCKVHQHIGWPTIVCDVPLFRRDFNIFKTRNGIEHLHASSTQILIASITVSPTHKSRSS